MSKILDELQADIICFQEMKSSRSALPRDVALPDDYGAFFSFPIAKGGYSGVAVYINMHEGRKCIPLRAEEGLSGKLQPKPPLTIEERISCSYPSADDMVLYPDEEGNTPATLDALDAEGRGLVVDFGLFVLINVYCPNETSDARLSFKMNYHLMLQERVRQLVSEGREVIVVGDINICATPLDHCDGHLPSNQSTFYEHPAREWFRNWLDPDKGQMVDVVRTFWPERKGMFTCWNQKISARATNYGTRVDYILVTRGLLKWIKHGDIQPSLKGSDHCPIYIDLHDEMTLESGEKILLRDVMKQNEERDLPRIASKHWDEFSRKQTLLSSFFTKGDTSSQGVEKPQSQSTASPSQANKTSTPASSSSSSSIRPLARSLSVSSKKRKAEAGPSSKKKQKADSRQPSLSSFVSKPSGSKSKPQKATLAASQEVILVDSSSDVEPGPSSSAASQPHLASSQASNDEEQLDADYKLALELAEAEEDLNARSTNSSQQQSQKSKEAWSNLFAPIPPPRCTIHNEPTKKYTVNKQGPNKGRTFYLCSRCDFSNIQLIMIMINEAWLCVDRLVLGTIREKGRDGEMRLTTNIGVITSSGRATLKGMLRLRKVVVSAIPYSIRDHSTSIMCSLVFAR
ncbi:DNase I-like protein [Panus rudis PR-1116 ss-1]|nr:DNase I-like protein [Panus rudis PR-1116 ss-1]